MVSTSGNCSVSEIIWGQDRTPSPEEFAKKRQSLPHSLSSPQEALSRLITIGQKAIDAHKSTHFLGNPYILNLRQVSTHLNVIIRSFSKEQPDDNYAFLSRATRHALHSNIAITNFTIYFLLKIIDDYFHQLATWNNSAVIQELSSLLDLPAPPTVLYISSKQSLARHLRTLSEPGILYSKSELPEACGSRKKLTDLLEKCADPIRAILLSSVDRIDPPADINMQNAWLFCTMELAQTLETKYIFSQDGLFPMIDDSIALSENIQLSSLPQIISEDAYAATAHETTVWGLSGRFVHDLNHAQNRYNFSSTLDLAFTHNQPSKSSVLSVIANGALNYIQQNLLNDTSRLYERLLEVLFIFSNLHECRGIPTLCCSVKDALQKIFLYTNFPDPDLESIMAETAEQAFLENPAFTWHLDKTTQNLLDFIEPHLQFRTYTQEDTYTSKEVFDNLPEQARQAANTTIKRNQPVQAILFKHKIERAGVLFHSSQAGALEASFISLGQTSQEVTQATDSCPSQKEFYQAKYNSAPFHKDAALCYANIYSQKAPLNSHFNRHAFMLNNNQKHLVQALCLDVQRPPYTPRTRVDLFDPSSSVPQAPDQNDARFEITYRTGVAPVPAAPPHTCSVYVSHTPYPFCSFSYDALHQTLLISAPSITEATCSMHLEFLKIIAFILSEDHTQYCCFRQFFNVSSTRAFEGWAGVNLREFTRTSSDIPCSTKSYSLATLQCGCTPTTTFQRQNPCPHSLSA